jgi:hypothetical protein
VASRPPVTNRVAATGQLSNDHGQVWTEYDIRAFSARSGNDENPEQSVVDWILRETGTNTWFGEPLSMLSASRDVVRVYHTPQIQDIVSDVIDRFVSTRSEANEVVVRLVTVDSPNWRQRAMSMLTPVQTQTPGIEAWLVSRENASLLLSDLSKRMDYREHNTPNLTIYNGRPHTIKNTRPRTFTRAVQPSSSAQVGTLGQIDEGFSLFISPLVSRDGQSMDAVVKCSVNQVEKFAPLWVDSFDQLGARQRTQIQIPQVSSWQLHERFRWPVNEVLLISRGVVATPGPTAGWNVALSRIIDGNAPRANALLFLESRTELRPAVAPQKVASGAPATNYRDRY